MNQSNALKPPRPSRISQAPQEPEDDRIGRYVGVSIALHLGLLALLTLKAVFYPNEPMQLERAIRVDMVGLPEKQAKLPPRATAPSVETKTETKPPKPEPIQPPPPKPEKVALPDKTAHPPKPQTDKIDLSQAKRKQDSALKRLEALRKLEEESAATKAAATAAAQRSAPVKGNVISPGSSLTGVAKLENESYLTDLDEHVKQHWHLPNFLANANLNATIELFIDERGGIIRKNLVKSSGNPIYDQTVLAAIEKAAPFPPPPPKLVNIFAVDGVRLGFPD